MSIEQLFKTACQVIMNEGDMSRVHEFYAEDFRAHLATPQALEWAVGLDGIVDMVTGLHTALPDYHETIEDLIISGDRVATRLTIRGTHKGSLITDPVTGRFIAPTNKSIEIADFAIFRVADGKIAEQWELTDFYSAYLQVGAIEVPGTLPASDQPHGVAT